MPKRAKASSKKRKPSLSKVVRPLPETTHEAEAAEPGATSETAAHQPVKRKVAHTTDEVIAIHRRRERDSSRPGRWIRRLTWTGLALIVIATWVLLFLREAPVNRNDSQTVAYQFLIEAQKSNVHRAYLLTSTAYQYHTTEDDFKETFLPGIINDMPDSKPQLVRRTIPHGGKSAEGFELVSYRFKFPATKDKKDFMVDCTLVKQPDGWAVDGFSTQSSKTGQ